VNLSTPHPQLGKLSGGTVVSISLAAPFCKLPTSPWAELTPFTVVRRYIPHHFYSLASPLSKDIISCSRAPFHIYYLAIHWSTSNAVLVLPPVLCLFHFCTHLAE
jgi:hypothetical protein